MAPAPPAYKKINDPLEALRRVTASTPRRVHPILSRFEHEAVLGSDSNGRKRTPQHFGLAAAPKIST